MLLFGWTEDFKSHFRDSRLKLSFFLNIIEKQGQLGVTISDIQFWENQDDGFTGYMIFNSTQAYLNYRSNATKFSLSLEEAIFLEKPTAKIRLVTAQKPGGGFDQIAQIGYKRAEVILGAPKASLLLQPARSLSERMLPQPLPVKAKCQPKSSVFLRPEEERLSYCLIGQTVHQMLVISIDSTAALTNLYYKNTWGAALQGAAVLTNFLNLDLYKNDKKMYRGVHSVFKVTAIGIGIKLIDSEHDLSFRRTLLSTTTLPFEWALND
jgi:hypothetical protein